MTRPRYGIDAPLLVRNFLLAGLALVALAGALVLSPPWRSWSTWLGIILLGPALYSLGIFCLMLWDSLVTKVRGRDAILDVVTWRGDEAVLDIGCGSGLLLVGAARRLTTGHATGVDLWLARESVRDALIAHLKLQIAKLKREQYGDSAESTRRLLDHPVNRSSRSCGSRSTMPAALHWFQSSASTGNRPARYSSLSDRFRNHRNSAFSTSVPRSQGTEIGQSCPINDPRPGTADRRLLS